MSRVGANGDVVSPRGSPIGELRNRRSEVMRHERPVGGVMLRAHHLVIPAIVRRKVVVRYAPQARPNPHLGFIMHSALLRQRLKTTVVQPHARALDLLIEVYPQVGLDEYLR